MCHTTPRQQLGPNLVASHPVCRSDISDNFLTITRAIRTTGAIILMIAYGYSVKNNNDYLLDVVEAAVTAFSQCMDPGAYLVDMIPLRKSPFLPNALLGMPTTPSFLSPRAVRYVPKWFPGAGWKLRGEQYRKLLDDTTELPYQFVKDQMVS
jgi:hypothetical protein